PDLIHVAEIACFENRCHWLCASCAGSGRWQDTCCPEGNWRMGGGSVKQASMRRAQRDRNGQRASAWWKAGTLPGMLASLAVPGLSPCGLGTEAISPLV